MTPGVSKSLTRSAPMTFEVNGKQYIAIASGLGGGAKVKLENTPEMRDQRNATVLYVFSL